ncbi:MAG: tetratricopeptide repeat protein [Myxococcaceae bacterium]
MNRAVADRLWPMLLGLGALLGGGLALQVYAERRGNAEIVVAIHDIHLDAADEGGGEGDAARRGEGALDADHQKAQAAARRGELALALSLYERSLAAHPGDVGLRDAYGYWLSQAKRPRDARAALEEAKRRGPDDVYVALHLGQVHLALGDVRAAEAELRRALTLRQGFEPAQRALGNLLRKRKQYDEAITLLQGAAQSGSNEDRARSLVALGAAQRAAGKRADAEKSFDKALEYAPARVEVRVGIARAWLASPEAADHQRALEMLRRGEELAPDLPQLHSALGRAFERVGQRSEAEASYERALRLDPSYRYARRRLLRIALDRKDFAKARAQADRLLEDAPGEPEHHFLAALVADRDGRDDDARTLYRAAIGKADGDYPEAYLNLGLLEKRAGHLDLAVAAYEKALALRPDYLGAMNNLAVVKSAQGQAAAAQRLLERALAQDPKHPASLLNLGELFMKLERRGEAIAMFERAIAAKPGYAEARLNLGVALTREARLDDALATYRALVEEEPRYVSGWFNLALAARQAKRLPEARAALEKALKIDPDHLASLRTLAELDQQAGSLDEALGEYQELLDRDPADRASRVAVAELLLAKGDAGACARAVKPLLTRAPQDADARRLYDRCAPAGDARTPQESP